MIGSVTVSVGSCFRAFLIISFKLSLPSETAAAVTLLREAIPGCWREDRDTDRLINVLCFEPRNRLFVFFFSFDDSVQGFGRYQLLSGKIILRIPDNFDRIDPPSRCVARLVGNGDRLELSYCPTDGSWVKTCDIRMSGCIQKPLVGNHKVSKLPKRIADRQPADCLSVPHIFGIER
jgi:hypothetical protein